MLESDGPKEIILPPAFSHTGWTEAAMVSFGAPLLFPGQAKESSPGVCSIRSRLENSEKKLSRTLTGHEFQRNSCPGLPCGLQ
jgi:hypothetical protein